MEREQTEHLNNVEQLINELKALKVQELVLLTKLETATKKRDTVPTTGDQQVKRGLSRQHCHRRPCSYQETEQGQETCNLDQPSRMERRKGTDCNGNARHPTQVHFITDNGVETWRAPNNLDKI
jgi:hypothetical protein